MGPVEFGRSNRVKGYRQCSNPKRVEFFCDDPDCDFHGGLPLHVVDEAIYAKRPTLLIGTVDKFALLPWYPEARNLFGLDTDGRCIPPDLVIQDELHLISGPLGSMVGHYETAINALCTHEIGADNGFQRRSLLQRRPYAGPTSRYKIFTGVQFSFSRRRVLSQENPFLRTRTQPRRAVCTWAYLRLHFHRT